MKSLTRASGALLLLVLQLLLSVVAIEGSGLNEELLLQIENESERKVQLLWRNHASNVLEVIIDNIEHGVGMEIGSYEGHEFVVRWPDQIPPVDRSFIKGPGQEVVTVRRDEQSDAPTIHQDSEFYRWKASTRKTLDACIEKSASPASRNRCFSPTIVEATDSNARHARLNSAVKRIGDKLHHYVCNDPDAVSSLPVHTSHTLWPRFGFPYTNHTVSVYLDTPSATIWTVDDFISEEECAFLANNTALHEESHGQGGRVWTGTFNDHQVNFVHPLFKLEVKALSFLSTMVGGEMLTVSGQEGFTVVRNGSDTTTHCDGACEGGYYQPGGRVASVSMFCEVPVGDDGREQGGVLFTKSGIFVRPKPRQALLLFYRDANWRMDAGLTEHAACPTTGSSLVVNLWLRDTVDSEFSASVFDEKGNALRRSPAAEGEPSSATTTLNVLH